LIVSSKFYLLRCKTGSNYSTSGFENTHPNKINATDIEIKVLYWLTKTTNSFGFLVFFTG